MIKQRSLLFSINYPLLARVFDLEQKLRVLHISANIFAAYEEVLLRNVFEIFSFVARKFFR